MFLEVLPAIGTSILWAGTAISGKMLAASGVPVIVVSFMRYFIAAVCLLPLIPTSSYKKITRRNAFMFLLMGLLMVVLFNMCFFTALAYTSATSVSLIGAMHPILTLLVVSFISRSVPSRNQLIAFVLSFAGAALVITQGRIGFEVFSGSVGELFMLAGLGFQIAYSLMLKKMSDHFSAMFLTFATSVSGLLFLIPMCANQETWDLVTNLSLINWAQLGYIGTLGTAIGLVLYSLSIKQAGVPMTSLVIFSTMPVFVFLLSFFLLGDSISVWQASGGLLVISALFLGLKKRD